MRIILPLEDGEEEINLKLPEDQVTSVEPRKTRRPKAIEELVTRALSNPAYAPRIRDMRLSDKKVAVVVDDKYRPTPAYRAIPLLAFHRMGVEYGDSKVWGVEMGQKADITITVPPNEALSEGATLNWEALRRVVQSTSMGGTIILFASNRDVETLKEEDPLQVELAGTGFEELLRRAERREWNRPEDWLHIIRAVKSRIRAFHHSVILVGARRSAKELKSLRDLVCVEDAKEAVEGALRRHGNKGNVLVFRNADILLPLEKVHSFKPPDIRTEVSCREAL